MQYFVIVVAFLYTRTIPGDAAGSLLLEDGYTRAWGDLTSLLLVSTRCYMSSSLQTDQMDCLSLETEGQVQGAAGV